MRGHNTVAKVSVELTVVPYLVRCARYARSLRQQVKDPNMRSVIARQLMKPSTTRHGMRRDSYVARPSHEGDEEDDAQGGAGDAATPQPTGRARMRKAGHATSAAKHLSKKHHIPPWLSRSRAEWVPLVQAVAAGRPRLLNRLPRIVGAPKTGKRGHHHQSLNFDTPSASSFRKSSRHINTGDSAATLVPESGRKKSLGRRKSSRRNKVSRRSSRRKF